MRDEDLALAVEHQQTVAGAGGVDDQAAESVLVADPLQVAEVTGQSEGGNARHLFRWPQIGPRAGSATPTLAETVEKLVDGLHEAVVPLEESRLADVEAPDHLPAICHSQISPEHLPNERPGEPEIDFGQTLFDAEEHGLGVLARRAFHILDPVVAERDIGVKLDEAWRAGQNVDLPDAKEIEIKVTVRIVTRPMKHVIVGAQFRRLGVGERDRGEVESSAGVKLRQQRLEPGKMLRPAADEDVILVLVMIHVLTLTPFYPHLGNEADGPFVAEPLAHLEEFGVHSTVIAAKPVSRARMVAGEQRPRPVWVRHLQLPGGAAFGSWGLLLYVRVAREVRRLHRSHPIDLIHAHTALPCGQPAALLARELQLPFVVTVHGVDAFSTGRERGLSRWWCERASRSVYRRAARVICVSGAVRREIEQVMGRAARTTVIYNGVDDELFSPLHDAEPAPPTILSVGRLAPEKRLAQVLRAVARLAERYPTLRCEIIGEGSQEASLTALAKTLQISGRVSFLGRRRRHEVAEVMRRCTIFALPSQEEALGCVYLEAMATEKSAVACRNQGIAEIIRHGENGWLVAPDDLEDLIHGLSVLLGDAPLREQLGREARRTIVAGFTLRHQAEQLSQVYRECLGASKRTTESTERAEKN